MRKISLKLTYVLVITIISVTIITGVSLAKQTLDVWFYPIDDPQIWKDIVDIWNQEHPDIEIEGQVVPWDGHVEKYTTAIIGGNLPDVGYTYPSLAVGWIQEADVLEPLNSYLSGDLKPDNLAGAVSYTYGDKLYAMPLVGNPKGPIWYNVDLFEEAGVQGLPTDKPMNHEEWIEISEKLTRDTDGDDDTDVYAFTWAGVANPGTADMVMPVFWSAGASLFNEEGKFGLNTPAGIEALEYIVDYQSKYSPSGAAGTRGEDVEQLFLEGKTAMIMSNLGVINSIDEVGINWDVGLPPVWKTDISIYQVFDALCIFNTSEKKDLAWKWIEFVMSPRIQEKLVLATGISSARMDIGTQPLAAKFESKGDKYLKALEMSDKALKYGRSHEMHSAIAEVWNIVLNEINAARSGQKTPEQALEDAETAVNRILKDY